jgi:tRNA A-37 threonylcarbamoyl transferase component Bud32
MIEGGGQLSRRGTEQLLKLLAARPRRLSSAEIDGSTVWIKRFDTEKRPVAKRLHALLSPVLPLAFLRASPHADAAGLAAREARKVARFAAAGFATPQLLWRGGAVVVLSQVAQIAEPELARLQAAGDVAGHDALLVEMAGLLGRVHAADLCHGRPHPRDMFRMADGTWGLLDFEEEPEAAMPLAVAQARDLWLLFMQIASRTRDEEVRAAAFEAWRAHAPAAIVPELRRAVAALSVLVPGLKFLRPLGLGKDGLRLLDSILFLRTALRASPAAQIKPDQIGTPT